MTLWWGYRHLNGSLQVKRWFGDPKDYTDDCIGNALVVQVVEPFPAANRDEATRILSLKLMGEWPCSSL